eukprot:scaffold1094_cov185-Alexandrium_tamarense.AAC.11
MDEMKVNEPLSLPADESRPPNNSVSQTNQLLVDDSRYSPPQQLKVAMGNTFPITSPPRPSPTRAILYIELRGCLGTLSIAGTGTETGDTSYVPTALNGNVPSCVFRASLDKVSDVLDNFGVAKMRKSRGHINNAKSSTYYCVMLEKICEGVDVDTASLSSFQSTTDIESEFDDAEVDVVDELPP